MRASFTIPAEALADAVDAICNAIIEAHDPNGKPVAAMPDREAIERGVCAIMGEQLGGGTVTPGRWAADREPEPKAAKLKKAKAHA